MDINKQPINPSENGPDPWEISVSGGQIHVDEQSLSIPSNDATIVLDQSETLTILDESIDSLAHIASYDADKDELRVLQFDSE